MCRRFVPNYYVQNVFSIPMDFYHAKNIKYILCDLDNTLDSYRLYLPSQRVVEWKEQLDKEGIALFVISNNHGPRVKSYCEALDVPFSFSTRKPLKKRLLAFINDHQIIIDNCLLVGDQLLTDVACGNGCHLLTILTEPIVKEDQWTTHFNRLIDRPLRWYLKKRKKIVMMEDCSYEKK